MHALVLASSTGGATVLALLLALASTILVSLAYVREHDAVAGLPALSLRHPVSSLRALLASRTWLAAFAMESSGFALYVAALALAPLALVQSVAAGGIGVLAVAAARLGNRRLSRRESIGAAVSVAGLLFLALSLTGSASADSPGSLAEIALWLGGTCVAAAVVLAVGRPLLGSGAAAGVAGGLLFSIGDISTKIATQGGARAAFAAAAALGYLLGTSLLQIGYQRGAALTIAGIATLLTNALPIAAGSVLLEETPPSGVLGAVRIVAFVTVSAGAILLARAPAAAGRRAPGEAMPPAEV